jgi:hypothetical protein
MIVSDVNKINDLSDSGEGAENAMKLRLAECLRDYVVQYGGMNQPFFVLKALATLTIDRIREGKSDVRFTASNIATEANIRVPEDKQPSSILSPFWNKLENLLKEREEGIQDFARHYGLEYYPWPKKDASKGGRGSNSAYYIEARPLAKNEGESSPEIQPGELAYIRELTPTPSWWAKRLIENGYRLEGWRRGLVMFYGAAILIAGGLSIAFVIWIVLLKFAALSGSEIAKIFLSLTCVLVCLRFAFAPFAKLFTWRIIMAPTSLVALDELNVQMEIVREQNSVPRNPGTIRLIRYAGICPVCSAKVELAEGGKEFPNRLIGRCVENPAEHVYSFDRFTCRGRTLR